MFFYHAFFSLCFSPSFFSLLALYVISHSVATHSPVSGSRKKTLIWLALLVKKGRRKESKGRRNQRVELELFVSGGCRGQLDPSSTSSKPSGLLSWQRSFAGYYPSHFFTFPCSPETRADFIISLSSANVHLQPSLPSACHPLRRTTAPPTNLPPATLETTRSLEEVRTTR